MRFKRNYKSSTRRTRYRYRGRTTKGKSGTTRRRYGYSKRKYTRKPATRTFKSRVRKVMYDTAAADSYLATRNLESISTPGEYQLVTFNYLPPSSMIPTDVDAIGNLITSSSVTDHYRLRTATMTLHGTNNCTAPVVVNIWKAILRKNMPTTETSFTAMYTAGLGDLGVTGSAQYAVGLTPFQNPRLTAYCKIYGRPMTKTVYPGQTMKVTLKQKGVYINKNNDRITNYILRKGTKILIIFQHGFPQSDRAVLNQVCYGNSNMVYSWTNLYTYSYVRDDTNVATVNIGGNTYTNGEADMARTSLQYNYNDA